MPKSDVILNWVYLGMTLFLWGLISFVLYSLGTEGAVLWTLPIPIVSCIMRVGELVILYKNSFGREKRYSSADYAIPLRFYVERRDPVHIVGFL